MQPEEKKKIEKKVLILSILIIALLGALLVFCGVTHRMDTGLFTVGACVGLALYWFVTDLLSIWWTREWEDRSEEQKRSYVIYALIDLAGYAGLIYFLVNLNDTTGALIYVVSIFAKKKFKDGFYADPEAEKEEQQLEENLEEQLEEQLDAEMEQQDEIEERTEERTAEKTEEKIEKE